MPIVNDEFQQARQRRLHTRRNDPERDAVEVELAEIAKRLTELCERHNGAAAMARVYTVSGHAKNCTPVREVSANFYLRASCNTGGNFIGHGADPFVQFKCKLTKEDE